MNALTTSARQRFWRGMREPWDLLGRMRQHPPLWRRYWRIVLVQVAFTLVAGAAVFWVGKRGADEWRDAFGADAPLAEIPAATAPATGAVASQEAAAPSTVEARSKKGPSKTLTPATTSGAKARPTEPASASAAPASSSPADATRAAGRSSLKTKADDDEDDDDDDEGEESPAVAEGEKDQKDPTEAAVERELETAADEIAKAPASQRAKLATQLAARAVARAKELSARTNRRASEKAKATGAPKDPEEARKEEIAERTQDLNDSVEALALGAHGLVTSPPKDYRKAHRARLKLEEQIGAVESEVKKLQALGGPGLTAAQEADLRTARADLLTARDHEHNLAGRLGAILGFLAVVYASLSIAQAGVLAMSRDFHDVLSRELSLLVNVAPEDPPLRPRIRLDVPWVRRKTNRRVQFFMGFLPGTALIWVVARLFPGSIRDVLVTALTTLWAAYWWLVMTAGLTARAWTPPEATSPPWYIRGWKAMTTKVFLLRWASFWGRIWERMSRRFNGPAERVEEQPLEFAGLALSRALALFPLAKLLVRPLFPVAAARLLVEHASTARLPVPVTADELALAAANAPDPEARAHSGTWRPTLAGDRLASGGR